MRFYILDDDINSTRMTANLIEDLDFGTVVGSACNPLVALEQLPYLRVDVCLIDYLMPNLDGAAFVRQINQHGLSIDFVMISQVSDSEMVSQAYRSGVVFFIHKPLNTIEFESVLQQVINKRKMAKQLLRIKSFLDIDTAPAYQREGRVIHHFEKLYQDIGIIGEKGSRDLLKISCDLYHDNQLDDNAIMLLLKQGDERPQTVAQRMRRAIAKGCHHLAQLGLEDYDHEIFSRYAFKLFDPQSIRYEMDYIKGKRHTGGKVNLSHFINATIIEVRDMMG